MQFLSENYLNGYQIFLGRFSLFKTKSELNFGFLHIHTSTSHPFVLPFVRYWREHDVWKWMNQFWCRFYKLSAGQGHEMVRRSKIKVTWHWNRSQKSILMRYLEKCWRNFNQTWQAHITVNAAVSQQPRCRSDVHPDGVTLDRTGWL